MNENDDLDAELTADTEQTVQTEAAVQEEVQADVSAEVTTDVEAAEQAADAAPVAAPSPVAKKAKGRAGRPFDASGLTNLGKARNLYASEPTLSAADLRKRLIADFGIPEKSAQTYASLVRKGSKK